MENFKDFKLRLKSIKNKYSKNEALFEKSYVTFMTHKWQSNQKPYTVV